MGFLPDKGQAEQSLGVMASAAGEVDAKDMHHRTSKAEGASSLCSSKRHSATDTTSGVARAGLCRQNET